MEIGIVPLLISLLGYIFLAPFLPVLWLINEISRIVISFILQHKFKGSITLVSDGTEAVWSHKRPGRTRMVLVGFRMKQPVSPEQFADSFENKLWLERHPTSGQRVYQRFGCILVEKYGYACWKEDEEFDVRRQIRYLGNKIYSKADVQSLFREASEDMGDDKPQWEMVIVPKYQEPGEFETTCLIICRFHHSYADGLTVSTMMKKYLTTGYTYYLNPCELPVKIPTWKTILYYANGIIFGPYVWMSITANKFRSFWPQLPSHSEYVVRSFTWTKSFELDQLRKIRKCVKNATVTTLIENAFISAATQVLPQGRYPENWYIGEVAALLPYKNEYPQNRFTLFMYNINSAQNEMKRIQSSSDAAWKAIMGPCIPALFFFLKFYGRFPVFFNKFIYAGASNSMVVSNVPSSKTEAKFVGTAEIMEIMGFPPQPTNAGITLACCSYNNMVKISANAEATWLKEKELEEIVRRIPGIISDWASNMGSKLE